MRVNREVMQKVRDAVADESYAFDMNHWGTGMAEDGSWFPSGPGGEFLGAERTAEGSCGTAACIAGWAVRFAGQPASQAEEVWQVCMRYTGAEALGLSDEVGTKLFYEGRWPAWMREDRRSTREKAVWLLDELLAGRDPWREEE